MKKTTTSIICILLTLTLLFAATSCTVKTVSDEIADHVSEVSAKTESSEAADNPSGDFIFSDVYDKSQIVSSLTSTNDSYIPDLPYIPDEPVSSSIGGFGVDSTVTAEDDEYDEYLTDEELAYLETYVYEYHRQEAFNLAAECIAFDIYEASGMELFKAFAIVDDQLVPGIAFTDYSVMSNDGDFTVYNCGFIQIIEEGTSVEALVTPELVENGVAVVPYGEQSDNAGYVISFGSLVGSFSGIYNNFFFRYDQRSDYAVSISVVENERSAYDESIDCYSYDAGKYLYRGDISYNATYADGFYTDEAQAYAAACSLVNQIIEIQNSNAYKVEKQVIILYSEDVINEIMLNGQKGTINGMSLDELNSIEVASNQILVVTTEGAKVVDVVDKDALAKNRFTRGLISFLGSALLVMGSIAIAVATAGSGTPVAIAAIGYVAGTCATVYGVSNMIEGAQDMYYGANGDITSSAFNPVLEGFKAVIDDDEKATLAYHIWGLSSSLIQSLTMPASAGYAFAKANNASVWACVGRAVAVEFVKIGVTVGVSTGTGYFTKEFVTHVTGDENIGAITAFFSSAITGFFTYNGLNKLDAKYNFSGYHNKSNITVKTDTDPDDTLRWDLPPNKKGETSLQHIENNHGPNAPLNPNKPQQTFFNDDPATIINNAWANKGQLTPQTQGARSVYEIRMPYAIGKNGETVVRIVVMTDTNQIVTAYPIP